MLHLIITVIRYDKSVLYLFILPFGWYHIKDMTGTGKYGSMPPAGGEDAHPRDKHEVTNAFKRERDNFRRMKPELTGNPEFQNNLVAVHENEIVGKAKHRLDLFFEMSKLYPDGSYFIGKVYPPS